MHGRTQETRGHTCSGAKINVNNLVYCINVPFQRFFDLSIVIQIKNHSMSVLIMYVYLCRLQASSIRNSISGNLTYWFVIRSLICMMLMAA